MSRFEGRSPHSSLVHLNGNLFCAVDVETTGEVPGYHEVWQLAVLPLDIHIKPLQGVLPFEMKLKLRRPENIDKKAIKVSRIDFAQYQLQAVDPDKALDLFEDWFDSLQLPLSRKLVPLAQNWPFDRGFVQEWMGPAHFDRYFHFHFRDTMSTALFINDRYDAFNEKIPFPKVGLGYLAGVFRIKNLKAHDALQDCVTTAEVYRRMLTEYLPIIPGTSKSTEPPTDTDA